MGLSTCCTKNTIMEVVLQRLDVWQLLTVVPLVCRAWHVRSVALLSRAGPVVLSGAAAASARLAATPVRPSTLARNTDGPLAGPGSLAGVGWRAVCDERAAPAAAVAPRSADGNVATAAGGAPLWQVPHGQAVAVVRCSRLQVLMCPPLAAWWPPPATQRWWRT